MLPPAQRTNTSLKPKWCEVSNRSIGFKELKKVLLSVLWSKTLGRLTDRRVTGIPPAPPTPHLDKSGHLILRGREIRGGTSASAAVWPRQ